MRRSELVAVRVEHLTYLPNGVEIFLPSSKTDQEGLGRTVFIPHANGERCPVHALEHWLEVSGINVMLPPCSRPRPIRNKALCQPLRPAAA